MKEMRRIGIDNADVSDVLVERAVILYAKWQEDFGGEGERFFTAFERLASSMVLSGDYDV